MMLHGVLIGWPLSVSKQTKRRVVPRPICWQNCWPVVLPQLSLYEPSRKLGVHSTKQAPTPSLICAHTRPDGHVLLLHSLSVQ